MRFYLHLSTLLCFARLGLPADRFEEFTAKYARPEHPVKILHAGCLGGAGTEWLAGGGLQPDGSLVLAGTALGPTLDIGKKITVLGRDGAAADPLPEVEMDGKGRPKTNADGSPKMQPFSWRHRQATGFVVRLTADFQGVQSVTRFGWGTGSITSAVVGVDGTIYVAGSATENLRSISSQAQVLAKPKTPLTKGTCQQTYVAKLSADGAKVLWLSCLEAPSTAPQLAWDKGGRLLLRGADFRLLDTQGKELAALAQPVEGGFWAMNPMDGSLARGGEHHWPTGREPWRCPTLDVFLPDGKHLHQLYDWGGPLVGLDGVRLVSDSAIRGLHFTENGDLLLHGWSDGGNSVLMREPYDLLTQAKMEGLGFSPWGAGVLSLGYVLRVDARTWQVRGGTPWMSYTPGRNKPNSARIHSLAGTAEDTIFAGSSTHGLIQTGDAICGGGAPVGEFVAVLNADATALRFCSALPGCALAVLQDGSADGCRWNIVTTQTAQKPLAILFGSAGGTETPPAINARQTKPAGGLDGYFLVLDLSK